MDNFSVKDALKFIRKDARILKHWTDQEIIFGIAKAIDDGTCAYIKDENGRLGIAFGVPDWNKKILYVSAIICTGHSMLYDMLLCFQQQFPSWKLAAHRHKKYVIYDTEKLCKKILNRIYILQNA